MCRWLCDIVHWFEVPFRLRKAGVAAGCLETFGSAANETTLDDIGV